VAKLVNQAVDLYLDTDMHDSCALGHRPVGGCQAVFSIRIALEWRMWRAGHTCASQPGFADQHCETASLPKMVVHADANDAVLEADLRRSSDSSHTGAGTRV